MAMETAETGSSTNTEARAGAETDHVMTAKGKLLIDLFNASIVQFMHLRHCLSFCVAVASN
jgi:hypothetical protein